MISELELMAYTPKLGALELPKAVPSSQTILVRSRMGANWEFLLVILKLPYPPIGLLAKMALARETPFPVICPNMVGASSKDVRWILVPWNASERRQAAPLWTT